jgi:hypothetical protein
MERLIQFRDTEEMICTRMIRQSTKEKRPGEKPRRLISAVRLCWRICFCAGLFVLFLAGLAAAYFSEA